MEGENRGSMFFSSTYRPPVPLDLFSSPIAPSSASDEVQLTDGLSYNYNGRCIPPEALKILIQRPELAAECGATEADVDAGSVSGLVFVSERDDGLETLRVALRFDAGNKVKVFSLAEIFGAEDFNGARLEDGGCFGGGYTVGSRIVEHCLIYVSTKEPVQLRRSPWTVVYKTNLRTGETERLTPEGDFDLSPSVSPSGKKVAVSSFRPEGWNGEILNLKTDIYVMNVDKSPLERKLLIKNGGWPSWGSDNAVFFHRGIGDDSLGTTWAVFRHDMTTGETVQVTPESVDAMTPAAISESMVAVATIRCKSKFSEPPAESEYRHIEIFDIAAPDNPVQITRTLRPKGDHYNPFVLEGGRRIGYHRCRTDKLLDNGTVLPRNLEKLRSPEVHKDVGLFRVSGAFPSISRDGSKLAFVDNEFKAVWLADSQGLRVVYEKRGPNSVFSAVWNQNPDIDNLFLCVGPSFDSCKALEIYSIHNVSGTAADRKVLRLTCGNFNNAFPSSNPEGSKLVFRSTRGGGYSMHKNLYIMEDAESGEFGDGAVTRLTNGSWTDTHCQWSPTGDWIVFSSSRDRSPDAPERDILDAGCFAVFLVKASDPTVVIRVVRSGYDMRGHVNHPTFSPDGRSIAVAADLAAVSAEPISMPQLLHPVRPYGDIFVVDIDPEDPTKSRDVERFHRITHSRYECGTPAWTKFTTDDPNTKWRLLLNQGAFMPACPYMYSDGGEGWHMKGHLTIAKRAC